MAIIEELAKKTSIAGKNSNVIGEKDSPLVLRGQGIKILWGNKFIDLVKNGKIVSLSDIILEKVETLDDITKDGIYIVGDKEICVLIGGSKIGTSTSETSYISFLKKQEDITPELKYIALNNIGFYYETLSEAEQSGLTSGIVYVADKKLLYFIENGILKEYSFTTSSIQKETQSEEDNSYFQLSDNIITPLKNIEIPSDIVILSLGATLNNGFRLYLDLNITILEVDRLITKIKDLDIEKLNQSDFYSRKDNIITNIENYENDNGKFTICYVQYPNNYNIGDYVIINQDKLVLINYSIELLLDENNTSKGNIITASLSKVINEDVEVLCVLYDNSTITLVIPANNISANSELVLSEVSEFIIIKAPDYVHKETIIAKPYKHIYLVTNVDKKTFTISTDNTLLNDIINSKVSIYDKYIEIKGDTILLENESKVLTVIGDLNNILELITQESNTSLGIFSNNFVGINSLLYDPIFKYIKEYPKYDSSIIIPLDINNEKYNYNIPNIEWIKQLMNLLIPKGTIVMWSGSEIPEGWVMCDGKNGTPNLIGKFIKASDTAGNTGGNNSITLSVDNLPDHLHGISEINTSSDGGNIHTHTVPDLSLETSNTSISDSSIVWKTVPENTDDLSDITTTKGQSLLSLTSGDAYLDTNVLDTDYSHSVNIPEITTSATTIEAHTHSIEAHNTSSTIDANNSEINIEPEYFSLIFIMKL